MWTKRYLIQPIKSCYINLYKKKIVQEFVPILLLKKKQRIICRFDKFFADINLVMISPLEVIPITFLIQIPIKKDKSFFL